MRSPYTPGVGLDPSYLAGREFYIQEYNDRLANAPHHGRNTIITGLRGVGKSVLVKHLALNAGHAGWLCVTRELTRRSNNEEELIRGLLAEMALRLKGVSISSGQKSIGLGKAGLQKTEELNLEHLLKVFSRQEGDKGDKLLQTIKYVAGIVAKIRASGLIIMLDEFQILEDAGGQYSLSLMLDLMSRLQSSTSLPVYFVLAGLPTLLGKCIEAKPHAERLFPVVLQLGPLSEEDSRKAITVPLETIQQPGRFAVDLVELLVKETEGYPYFVQYFADMAFNTFNHHPITRNDFERVLPEIYASLDESFFSGRLYPLTPKERAVTLATSKIAAPFTPTGVLEAVKSLGGEVTMGTIQQYLLTLQSKNIIYKVRRGAYQYALPLFGKFLTRCLEQEDPTSILRDMGQI